MYVSKNQDAALLLHFIDHCQNRALLDNFLTKIETVAKERLNRDVLWRYLCEVSEMEHSFLVKPIDFLSFIPPESRKKIDLEIVNYYLHLSHRYRQDHTLPIE
jgi:hypothetical protein